jgi:hypothetical protein
VPNYVTIGLQGVCSKSKFSCGKGLLVAKSVVTVSSNQKVPVKLLNPTNDIIVIPKGRTVAEFNVLNSEYDCALFSDSLPTVQHAKLCETDTVQNLTVSSVTKRSRFSCNNSMSLSRSVSSKLSGNLNKDFTLEKLGSLHRSSV